MLKKRLGIEAIERDWSLMSKSYYYYKIPTALIIPEGCVRIGRFVFWRWEKLRKVEIPKSVEEIGYRAFGYCENAKIILEKPMREFKSIGYNAFHNLMYVKEKTGN